MKFIYLLSLLLFLNVKLFPCTGLSVKSESAVVFGMNEDWYIGDDDFYLLLYPGSENVNDILTIINVNDGDWRIAINDKGLCYDSYAAPYEAVTLNNDKPLIDYIAFRNYVLYNFETVDEVIDYYNQYYCGWLAEGQIMFSDKYGNAVVFEGNNIITNYESNYLVCTNFYQSNLANAGHRYTYAVNVLDTANTYNVDLVTSILEHCHQDDYGVLTQFTLIFDQIERDVHIYFQSDFETLYSINYDEVMSNANSSGQSISLKSIFQELSSQSKIANLSDEIQIFPNPARGNASLTFTINNPTELNISIYNQMGVKVADLSDRLYHSGTHTTAINMANLKNGVYYAVLTSNRKKVTKKVIVQN